MAAKKGKVSETRRKTPVSTYIHPKLRERLTPVDLLRPSLGCPVYFVPGHRLSGRLFSIKAPGYSLAAGINDKVAVFSRNGATVRLELPPPEVGIRIEFRWAPEGILLELFVQYGAGPIRDFRKTPPTFVPPTLVRWIRERALVQTESYGSSSVLRDELVEQFMKVDQTILATEGWKAFWDLTYSENKKTSKSPKREPDVHAMVRALMYDVEVTKNIQINPEAPIGSGKMDFLFTAPLTGGGTASVCCEFKSSHSSELITGLTEQLPRYMRTKGVDKGLYVVLDYGPEWRGGIPKTKGEFFKTLGDLQFNLQFDMRHVILTLFQTEFPGAL